ncbi:MAG: sulfatase [Verrucomicrobiaceae bacterium]|nr:sulfatase [Verrucomicrobiaceae bacterium]
MSTSSTAGAPFQSQPFMRSLAAIFLTLCPLLSAPALAKPNVLLIISDDLRPQLGCYGDPIVKTPNLDHFAKTALRFDRAYVQSAICSPSRNSFLSGLRPATTGLRGFGTTLRDVAPDVVTLPQHFKSHGWQSAAIGKVFHVYAETGLGSEDDPASWSQPLYLPKNPVWGPAQDKIRAAQIEADRVAGKTYNHSHDWPRGEAIEAPNIPDHSLRDGETALKAADFLQSRSTKTDEPFFLAVGFYQPHLPFVAPKKYFDLYDPDKLPLPSNTQPPTGAPPYAMNVGMAKGFLNFPELDQQTDDFKRRYLQAYLANISYMDACTGLVLDALEKTGLAENTIVIFIGDHGYLMGEHGSWGHKHCNYETATRTPLLVRAHGMKAAGESTSALVEFVDLYPTLADLAQLPIPPSLEGTSFAPLLTNPSRPWKTAAFSEMLRGKNFLGRSLRTATHRYVEWTGPQGKKILSRELYDLSTDPIEKTNLAEDPTQETLLNQLAAQLQSGWKASKPNLTHSN